MRTQRRLSLATVAALALLFFGFGCSGSSGSGKADSDKKAGDKKGGEKSQQDTSQKEKPQTSTVRGKVTYKGQRLSAGIVLFVPVQSDQSKGYSGAIQPDGTYRVQNVPVGESRVMIETDPPAKPKGAKKGEASKYVPIPPKYADLKTTPLRLDVKLGEQEHNIKLTD
jgi:hypothetical protein